MKDNIVQNIAHKLFLARSDVLEHELTEQELSFLLKEKSEGYCLKDDKLIFSSYEDRDYYVVRYHFSETDSDRADAEKTIIQAAFSIWEKSLRGDRSTAGLFLSLYEDKINVFQVLLESERNQYEVTSLADQFIKYSRNIDINTLYNFFSVIYNKHNQYVGTFTLLGERLASNPEKCHEIINKFHSDIKQGTLHLYNIALFSLKKENYASAIDILLDDIEKNDSLLSPQSLWILGRIVEASDTEYKVDEINKTIIDNISSAIKLISDSAIQAAVNTVEKIPGMRNIIRELLESNNTEAIKALAHKVYTKKQLTSHTDFPFWMSHICESAINNAELSGLIFHIFSFLTKDESKHDLLTDCLFIMIKNNSVSENNQVIESFFYDIANHPDLLNKVFTLTLIDENPETTVFSRLLSTYLFVHRSKHILEYSLGVINDFTERDFIFLVRRTLGFISNEHQLMSLILSLLRVKNAEKRTYPLVKVVIINEIAMDYPSYVIDEIGKHKKNIKGQRNKIKKLYNEILTEVENYISSFTVLPRIKELEPSSMLVHAFQKEKDKVMARKNDLANENSLVFKIASRIHLKAGIGSFHYNDYNDSGYSEPSYLKTFSSSYSLPRRYVMDNVGYDIRLAQFRCAKKDTV
ncbi:hypothetical protein INP82_16270 [Citrobacter sedlakii]|uniref:hypothetical protein n=1 Tax=Citrobacter TaxID=544 RepID=UPI001969AA86|nr:MULTISPECIES: hypothetical protein [Citrobacter]MBM9568967.1 hypothetical protein [Citrobacter sedlakii]HBL4690163.1 hypothetical protein [Citrobacter sedlakii]HBL4704602.1 hypothetical protein [Citrobacter sedlakii]HBL4719351.1 hypothetical protein [Citrobacter sedlakii]HCA7840302.1 hypothetical protein [Citrobacter sedlakii]